MRPKPTPPTSSRSWTRICWRIRRAPSPPTPSCGARAPRPRRPRCEPRCSRRKTSPTPPLGKSWPMPTNRCRPRTAPPAGNIFSRSSRSGSAGNTTLIGRSTRSNGPSASTPATPPFAPTSSGWAAPTTSGTASHRSTWGRSTSSARSRPRSPCTTTWRRCANASVRSTRWRRSTGRSCASSPTTPWPCSGSRRSAGTRGAGRISPTCSRNVRAAPAKVCPPASIGGFACASWPPCTSSGWNGRTRLSIPWNGCSATRSSSGLPGTPPLPPIPPNRPANRPGFRPTSAKS